MYLTFEKESKTELTCSEKPVTLSKLRASRSYMAAEELLV